MRERRFPPGIGQMAWIGALVVALVVSIFAAIPHYTNRAVTAVGPGGSGGYNAGSGGAGVAGSTGSGPSGGPVAAGSSAGGTAGSTSGGSAGHYVGGTSGSVGTGGSGAGSLDCAAGRNGGATAPGVTASTITVASTIVTSGVGAGFLGQAQDGIQAALQQANNAGGICGRHITLQTVNSGWDEQQGSTDISNYIHSGSVFALVGQPDSEGLAGAIDSGTITSSGMPVVGTDGLLKDQYGNPWVWPVAAPTVTNMHIIAKYAYSQGATSASDFGIVYDSYYRFGSEGAAAFDAEVKRLTGSDIPGYGSGAGCASPNKQYCGFNGDPNHGGGVQQSYVSSFDGACHPCKVVVMLLEPGPMESWMNAESGDTSWYQYLYGGEPLFDDNLGGNCPGCGGMRVWTGYHPAVQPFDSEPAVASYVGALKSVCPSCDAHNEFTEGDYIGAQLFIAGLKAVADKNEPLTRANLQAALDSINLNDGLTAVPLQFNSSLHLANTAMAGFSDNFSGSFNGWTYMNTNFVPDPAPGQDLQG